MPQGMRGITLGELKAFYDSNRDWIEEKRWRCSACKRYAWGSSRRHGPCSECGNSNGKLMARNLYEVNEVMIKPRCAVEKISYVEYLARHARQNTLYGPHVPFLTFVSHWWGEEFPKFMATLERFAQVRVGVCTTGYWINILIALAIAGVVLPPLFLYESTGWDTNEMVVFRWDARKITRAAVFDFCARLTILVCVIVVRISQETVKQETLSYSFWICAFCNNQFAIEHALGIDGDLTTSSFAQALHASSCRDVVAIFDQHGEIYNRVWCIFEFFMVKEWLPKVIGRFLKIYMANEWGVISEGDATAAVIHDVRKAIEAVNTAESEASSLDDKELIEQHLQKLGCTHEQLDCMLRQMGRDGLYAAEMRRVLPLLTFNLGPMMGMLMTEWMHSLYRWSLPANMVRIYVPGRILYTEAWATAVFCMLLLVICVGIHEVVLQKRAGTSKNIYRKRILMGSFLMMVPGLTYASCHIFAHFLFSKTGWMVQLVACSRNICFVCQQFIAMTGLTGGLLYVVLRDQHYFCKSRQWAEDKIFA